MAEFIFKRSDYTHADPEKDRRGVHKRTDFINYKPDGFSDFSHGNGPGSYLNDFIIIKVPGITLAEAEASDNRRPWKDDFDYEIIKNRPAQGEYDIRVFEKNAGAINQNAITGGKATRIRDYMTAWGCSNFSATDARFTFSLWDAVRSDNFWDVPLIGTKVSFALNNYSGATGIGQIVVAVNQEMWEPFVKYISINNFLAILAVNGLLDYPGDNATIVVAGITYTTGANLFADVAVHGTQEEIEVQIGDQITRKITEKGGTVISQVYPDFVFEIERSDILTRFRADVKRRMEQVYMRHQYGISQADHNAIVAAGGIVTMTRAEFLGKLIDKMAV